MLHLPFGQMIPIPWYKILHITIMNEAINTTCFQKALRCCQALKHPLRINIYIYNNLVAQKILEKHWNPFMTTIPDRVLSLTLFYLWTILSSSNLQQKFFYRQHFFHIWLFHLKTSLGQSFLYKIVFMLLLWESLCQHTLIYKGQVS